MKAASEWEKYVDDAAQTPYYYNTRTGESSWEVPEGFVEEDGASAATDGAEPAEGERAAPAKPPRWRRYTDDANGKSYYYDEANDVTQWDEPEGEIEDGSEAEEEEEDGCDEDTKGDEQEVAHDERKDVDEGEAGEMEKDAAPDAASSQSNEAAPAQNWIKHVDKATGKPYYHDTVSNKTQWEAPDKYTQASEPKAISAEYLEYLHRSRAEKLARVTQQALDPEGNLSRLNALLSRIDSSGNGGGSAEPAAATEEVGAPEDIEQSMKERARAEWQQHVDPHSQRYYYHNIVTGETQWQKPDAPVVSALADWVPPETPDTDTTSVPKRLVSGQHYAASAKFNRVSGKFEKLGGDDYWQAIGVAADRAGRQMSHFFDVQQLEKNREEAKRVKDELKRKNIDWKKVAAEKKAKKQKRKNEWIYQD